MSEDDPPIWHVDMEVSLFHAMRGHKPVGVNRFFQMVFIHDKLNNATRTKITSKQVWSQLSKMYDLQALNESEILPFPNKPADFCLPEGDFSDLMSKDYPRMSKHVIGQTHIKQENIKQESTTPTSKGPKSSGTSWSSTPHVTSGNQYGNTPDISPKRKRTRNAQSTPGSGQNTPDGPPPTKRRR